MHQPGMTRSRTGCRTCRIRKVKCDEEKQRVQGYDEPQCNKCSTARIRCEWKGGPIPRKSTSKAKKGAEKPCVGNPAESKKILARRSSQEASISCRIPLLSQRVGYESHTQNLQGANSLVLSAFDRDCIGYIQNSTLVVLLGKHWPWSTVSYAYHKIAVHDPMVMSMMLASTAGEIHRSRMHDQEELSRGCSSKHPGELDGRAHYGRALSSLRHALKQGVTSPSKIEAIYVTLWLMVDYENRFGNNVSAVNIHIQGVQSMLKDHIVPLLQNKKPLQGQAAIEPSNQQMLQSPQTDLTVSTDGNSTVTNETSLALGSSQLKELHSTSVPLFFLWTLYFFSPETLFAGPEASKLDTEIFQLFLESEGQNNGPLTLPDLYRISRQSPSRFWGDSYSLSAQLDDLENFPGLALYHRSHVIRFKTSELFRHGWPVDVASEDEGFSPYQRMVDEFHSLSIEYDTVLTSVKTSPSCDTSDPHRRVLETNFWASITYYSAIVYFHLGLNNIPNTDAGLLKNNTLMSLDAAVSQLLELSLKLHRSRPHMVLRITWPLFIAGIATSDQIYKDWVSIRLRELGRYGQNYSRISKRFDEMVQGVLPHVYGIEAPFLGE